MKKFIFYLLFFTFVFNIEGNTNGSDPFKQDVEEVFNKHPEISLTLHFPTARRRLLPGLFSS